ncbi:TonB-dependent receptor [Caulobacter hibisci]|uniref:TonB-dependent receptor n=1 Tax=Caulobacter hibisci TaxID=2035993 RepID=A0ABS0SW68_9CAUL|nr:TonB-dependent receptor [Caulobacter hibisci]MBI1682882.1 TonB-dependent receptor [Caulobacter hibisci]
MRQIQTPARPRLKRRLIAGVALAFVSFSAAHAADPDLADAPDASAAEVDRVVVTAAKQTERKAALAQGDPASISVLTADVLERRGVASTLDLVNLTPNLYQPRNTMSYSAAQYFLRGIGELDAQGEPSVGTFVDGVYITRNLGAMQELLDVADIQVDRGPVIHLGHQVEGGAVRLTTVVPDNQVRRELLAGYGSFDEIKLGVLVSGPIVEDKVYGSFAISRHQRDGTDYNRTLGRRENDIALTQARAKLRFTPNADLDFTLALDGTADDSLNRGYGNLLNADKYALNSPIYPKNRYRQAGVTATTLYRLSPDWSLSSVTAWRVFEDHANYDNTGDRFARNSSPLRYYDNAWSQDLKLSGMAGKARIVAGIYLLYEDWITRRNVNASTTFYGSPNRIVFTPVHAAIDQKTYNAAAYVQTDYDLTPRLTLTGGLRYNLERHTTEETLSWLIAGGDHTFTLTDVSQVADELAILYGAPTATAWHVKAHKSWTQLLPRLAATFQAAPGVKAYASISQGAKSGGFDFRANSPSNSRQAVTPYAPEKVTTYEAGVKSDLSGGRVRLNGAVFWNDFTDIQISAYDPLTAMSRRFNAGDGHSVGIELEAAAQITSDWSLDATASWLDTELDTYRGTYSQVVLAGGAIVPTSAHSGSPLPNAPKFQGKVASDYRLPIGLPGEFTLGVDLSYQGATFLTAANSPYNRMPPQTFLDAALRWKSPDGAWRAALRGRNLLDRRYLVWSGLGTTNGSPAYATFYSASWTDPRTVYLEVRHSF